MTTTRRLAIGIGVSTIAMLFAGYSAAYFAWFTATPSSKAQLRRAQYDTYVWFAIAVLGMIVALILAVRLFQNTKRKTKENNHAPISA
jgi:H+/Cl- antiporter ClcA